MSDDLALRLNPTYKHLFEDKPPTPKKDVSWLKTTAVSADGTTLRNSECGQFQCRKHGEPPVYSLYSIRVPPFARLIKDGFKSFAEVQEFLKR